MKPASALANPEPAVRKVALRVMVVDDNQGEFDLLDAGFAACGVDVELITATSGHLAIASLLVTETWPRFALVDVGMPIISGFEIALQLIGRKIPTVMISGHVTPDRRDMARSHGAIDLLAKPADAVGYTGMAARILELVDLGRPSGT